RARSLLQGTQSHAARAGALLARGAARGDERHRRRDPGGAGRSQCARNRLDTDRGGTGGDRPDHRPAVARPAERLESEGVTMKAKARKRGSPRVKMGASSKKGTSSKRVDALRRRYGSAAVDNGERLNPHDFADLMAWRDELDPHYAKLWLDFSYGGL